MSGAVTKVKVNRSSEELQMREIVAARLRELWPDARIIHELPLRYSTNRIDVAAVTQDALAVVEIKSSKDDTSRLRAQLRGFEPIATNMICAVAPSHWTPATQEVKTLPRGGTQYSYTPCETRRIIDDTVGFRCGVWLVEPGAPIIVEHDHWPMRQRPCVARLLDLMHVSELVAIAERHKVQTAKRPNHTDLTNLLNDHLTGATARRECYAALRNRDAFDKASDAPLPALISQGDA